MASYFFYLNVISNNNIKLNSMDNVLVKFHQIYKTCAEMMIDRGYSRDILEKNYLGISPDEFQKM